MTSVLEALKSAQFVVDAAGRRVAVQLNPKVWQALLTWLENIENAPTVEELIEASTINKPQEPNNTLVIRGAAIHEDHALASAAASLSEPSFAGVWDNPEDDIYNDL